MARRLVARMVGGESAVSHARVRAHVTPAWLDHLAIAPVLLGSGEHLLAGLDLPALGYACTEQAASDKATHVVITKRV